jgi:hypothetical protein
LRVDLVHQVVNRTGRHPVPADHRVHLLLLLSLQTTNR